MSARLKIVKHFPPTVIDSYLCTVLYLYATIYKRIGDAYYSVYNIRLRFDSYARRRPLMIIYRFSNQNKNKFHSAYAI